MVGRIVLTVIILVAVHEALGAAATLGVGTLLAILYYAMAMIWSAKRRNNMERAEFQRVNSGYAEPDPRFLIRVWNADKYSYVE
ncbi:MAG: hypothetical protein KDB07_13705 [Planctomycetes bacterium]|nr:hypothetical protein [Planctomycetota bacterium]